MSLVLPGILLRGAAVFGFVGSLLRNMASSDAPEVIQAKGRKARNRRPTYNLVAVRWQR
jgi:hypothetical protein